MSNLGSFVTLDKKGINCGITVLCSTQGLDLDNAGRAMIQNTGLRLDTASEERATATLAGLPAERITYSGRSARGKMTAHIFTAKRANTGFIFFMAKAGKLSSDEAQEVTEILELID